MTHPVAVSGRHRPHEVLLLAVSLLVGIALILGAPAPGSITALLPRWEVHVWAAGLAVSGAAGLAGCLWRPGTERAMWLEAGAMLTGAGSLLFYVVALLALGDPRGILAGGITAAWMAANLVRAGQIRRDLRGM